MRTSQRNLKYVVSDATGKRFRTITSKVRKKHLPTISRVVRWFEKDGDALVGESRLDDLELSKLQRLFHVSRDNPMYDCYPIKTPLQMRYIQKATNHPIDLLAYDYFLECDGDGITQAVFADSTNSC
jgi:hypothetical protein